MIDHVRIVFLGTPGIAVPTLERLAGQPGWKVVAAVSQPDRPAGRGHVLQAPAVKVAAQKLGIAVFQPTKMRAPEAVAWLEQQCPDVLAVVAYGQLLPAAVFEMPRWGAVNAHASLLPAYRGAAPIQWAIARGETETGVTTMQINAGLDTGDMLLRRAVTIPATATAPELGARVAEVAAELMVETLAGLERGTMTPQPQPAEGSLAPLLTRGDGRAQWTMAAGEIYNRWRGFQPWPGLHTQFRGEPLAVGACRVVEGAAAAPGELAERAGELCVACGRGWLALEQVRLAGRQVMPGMAFAHGAHLNWGSERLD